MHATIQLRACFGDDAPALASAFLEDVGHVDWSRPNDLHRLAGACATVGEAALARHLRLASEAVAAGRPCDVQRLQVRLQRLCVPLRLLAEERGQARLLVTA